MKNLIEVWKNKGKILEGIVNSVFKRGDVEEVAQARHSVCNTCEHKDSVGKSCLAPGSQPCCFLCGCSLAFKTRSMSSECPDGRWKALMTDEEEEILNEKLGLNK
jgi:hypothetical protein